MHCAATAVFDGSMAAPRLRRRSITCAMLNAAYWPAKRKSQSAERSRPADLIEHRCSSTSGPQRKWLPRARSDRSGLLIITNNLNIAEILSTSRNDIILVGGKLRKSDRAMVGSFATEFIRKFKVDIAVIAVSAIDRDGALLDFDAQEVEVARAIIANARL